MITSIPTLTTTRLVLRAPVYADFPAYAALMGSARAVHMGGPYDTRAAWGLFCHDVGQWQLFGHGALMIEVRGSGDCVGQVGINHGALFPERSWAGCSMRVTEIAPILSKAGGIVRRATTAAIAAAQNGESACAIS